MTDSPDTVLRSWFEELWNQGREDTIDRLLAQNGRAHGLGPEPIVGPAAFHPFYRQLRQAFPDLRVEVLRSVAQGDMASVCCHATGTHSGPGFGPATGRRVDFTGQCTARIQNGQIVEGWNNFDFMSCYQQIGLLPQLPA